MESLINNLSVGIIKSFDNWKQFSCLHADFWKKFCTLNYSKAWSDEFYFLPGDPLCFCECCWEADNTSHLLSSSFLLCDGKAEDRALHSPAFWAAGGNMLQVLFWNIPRQEKKCWGWGASQTLGAGLGAASHANELDEGMNCTWPRSPGLPIREGVSAQWGLNRDCDAACLPAQRSPTWWCLQVTGGST